MSAAKSMTYRHNGRKACRLERGKEIAAKGHRGRKGNIISRSRESREAGEDNHSPAFASFAAFARSTMLFSASSAPFRGQNQN
jgi:hypothetical protein